MSTSKQANLSRVRCCTSAGAFFNLEVKTNYGSNDKHVLEKHAKDIIHNLTSLIMFYNFYIKNNSARQIFSEVQRKQFMILCCVISVAQTALQQQLHVQSVSYVLPLQSQFIYLFIYLLRHILEQNQLLAYAQYCFSQYAFLCILTYISCIQASFTIVKSLLAY
jgi:hypothetical protein